MRILTKTGVIKVFLAALGIYLLTSYGGIRSPDGEIVFEACDALKARGVLSIHQESDWEGFGMAEGRDGGLYSIFGPLQSIACVPFLALADLVQPSRIFEGLGLPIPASHYISGGLAEAGMGEPVSDKTAHGRRSAVAWIWGSLLSAAGVAVFFRITCRFAGDSAPAGLAGQKFTRAKELGHLEARDSSKQDEGMVGPLAITAIYAIGTLAWPYAGTFFTEPLAILLVLLSFDRLLAGDRRGSALLSGGFLGLAVWAHITAILFVPFFAFLAMRKDGRRDLPSVLSFSLSLGLGILLLGLLQYQLFGNPLETGRTVGGMEYGSFVAPWRGLAGLLLGGGKGLFVTCPAILIGLWSWRHFHHRYPTLSLVLGTAAIFRLVFVASRSDWHGGFSHGSRLLVMLIPFLLLPAVPWLQEQIERRRVRTVVATSLVGLVSVLVQWQMVAGDLFLLLHSQKLEGISKGIDLLRGDRLYLDWDHSPLLHLFHTRPAPMFFAGLFPTSLSLWSLGLVLLLPLWFLGTARLVSKPPESSSALPAPPLKWAPFLLGAMVLALYLPSLGNGLTNWDDPQYVANNPFATKGLLGIPLAFLSSHEDAYYPVTHGIYSLIQTFFGTSPLAHHAVQIAIFALAVACLPWALAAFGIPAAAGFWAALLWAFHPMRVESVTWVANLKDPAALLGIVAAFGFYGAGRRRASAVSFTLALLAKSMFFPVAGLFVLLEARKRPRWTRAWTRALPWILPALLVACLGWLLHDLPSLEAGRSRPGGSVLGAIPSAFWLPWWYLWRLVSLQHPQTVYGYVPVGWLDLRFAIGLLAWAALAIWIARRRGESRWAWVLAAWAWTLPFLPVTGLVPLLHTLADRYAFLPALPVAVGFVAIVHRRTKRLPRVAVLASLGGLVVLQGALNIPRQLDFRHSITLWEADLPKEPDNWTVRYSLAGAYGGEGRWQEAIIQLQEAQRIRPHHPVHDWIAFAKLADGDMEPARVHDIAERLRLATDIAVEWMEIAAELLREGEADVAKDLVLAVVQHRDDANARLLLSMIEGALGEKERSLAEVERALLLDPGVEQAHLLRASLLFDLERYEEVLAATTVQLPDSRDRAYLAKTRAMTLLRLRRFEEALTATSLELEPGHRPIVAAARAASLLLLGRREEALAETRIGNVSGVDFPLLEQVRKQAEEELVQARGR